MNFEERLNAAVDYAIDTHYALWNRQNEIWKEIQGHKYICLFGTGHFYNDLVGYIYNDRYEYVGDNNPEKIGKYVNGRRCLSPEEIKNMKNDVAVIIMIGNYGAVYNQLRMLGICCYPVAWCYLNAYDIHYNDEWFISRKKDIVNALQLFADDLSREIYVECICNRIAPPFAEKVFYELQMDGEYFNTDVFRITKGKEYMVDCGAFVGDSVDEFIKATDGSYGAVYAFEADEATFAKLEDNTKNYHDVYCYNLGVSNNNGYVYINGSEETTAKVDALDNLLKDKRVTYIKMDIETYELKALEGGKHIIMTQQPKLCISAYHYLSDLWEVPRKIKNIDSRYKVYLRHHSPCVWDSNCYAYVDEKN